MQYGFACRQSLTLSDFRPAYMNMCALYGVITLYANFSCYLTQAYSVLMVERVNERSCIAMDFLFFSEPSLKI